MPKDPFDVKGLDDFKALVDRFVSKTFIDAGEKGMEMALLFLHSQLPEAPPPPRPGQLAGRWGAKQRRYFFWALSRGIITAGRTNTLLRSFTTDVTRSGSDIFGSFGTNRPHAPWVVGPDRTDAITIGGVEHWQAYIHKDRWWQFDTVVEAALPAAYAEFEEAFMDVVDAAIRKG